MYRLRVDAAIPEKYGVTSKEFRDTLLYTLQTEGVSTSLWVPNILPAMEIYQTKEGYGHGCPWTCPYGSGKEYIYDPGEYPVAQLLIENAFNLDYFYPPNNEVYLDGVVHAFHKLWENLDLLFQK
jgi:hypothetical protein